MITYTGLKCGSQNTIFKLTIDIPPVDTHGPEVHHLIEQGSCLRLTLIGESAS
jgi:hypothetical protein